jgi:hypothetical protein
LLADFAAWWQEFEFNGYTIPKGWQALYRINSTHKDSRVYTEPEQFDPDRFSPNERSIKNKSLAWWGLAAVPDLSGNCFCPDGNEDFCGALATSLHLGVAAKTKSHP